MRIKAILTSVAFLMMAVLLGGQNVAYASQALSPDDQKLLWEDASWYDSALPCGDLSSGGGAGVDLSGPNVETSFKYFLGNGYTGPQAAGIVGNMMKESGGNKTVNPTALNPGGAYGIVQWLGGRLTAMRAWVSAQDPPGNQPDTLQGQLPYVLHELNTSYADVAKAVKATGTPQEAATIFNHEYEVSGDDSGDRERNAANVYQDAQAKGWVTAGASSAVISSPSDTSTSSTDSSGCVSGSGSEACKNSGVTGLAKIFCEAQQYAGIYYRWGGGHQGVQAFLKGCPDPSNPGTNTPHGGAPDPTNHGVSGNPSPCATDCSGLVIMAVYFATGQELSGNVYDLVHNTKYWQEIPMAQAQSGDVVTKDNYNHIEIVDSYVSAATFKTFGSHETGTRTGPSQGQYQDAYRYIGPGL